MTQIAHRPIGELVVNLDRRRVPVKASDRRGGPYPYYGASGVVDHVDDYLFEGLHLLVAEDGENLRSRNTPVAFLADGRFWVNNHAHVLQGNSENDTRYLSYALEAADISGYVTGSAQPKLSQAALAAIEVPAPPLDVQRAIAATLGALDDKIESNRQLAERASAVIDASASQLRARTSTEVLPLADLVEFNRLSVKPHSTDALRYIDIASVSPGQIDSVQELTWDEAPSRARRGVSDGDVIYSTVRPGNRAFALIVDPTPGSVASTGFAVMSPSVRLGSSMLTSVVGAPEFAEYLESVAHGSAYPAVGIQAMGSYPVVVPKEAVVAEQFEADTMPLRRRVAQARAESERLAALRDTLLPELLSGRMRVPTEGVAA
ncbi:restriction endonuclease subunit S [Micrococcus terreus]|uniref:Type I restriction enzyme, S subunit n=1 Tax=Micrococcus terreus TaxID=574650 RepID=A0A1I7MQL8_9MICC|nr:restriction endonuclease subunit S [Micrococcus terreus]SFV24237.1 type I restriction enzyme, S subunit [Micrococcus terreus]